MSKPTYMEVLSALRALVLQAMDMDNRYHAGVRNIPRDWGKLNYEINKSWEILSRADKEESLPSPDDMPAWIPVDEEPEGFNTQDSTVNQAFYRGYIYHWNSPCEHLHKKAGWSLAGSVSDGD